MKDEKQSLSDSDSKGVSAHWRIPEPSNIFALSFRADFIPGFGFQYEYL